MKQLIILICLLLVIPSYAQDTVMTPDEAIVMGSPDGWLVEIEDLDAIQAELSEQGISINLDFPGLIITLNALDDATANIDVTLFYGQDLEDSFGAYMSDDDGALFSDPQDALQSAMATIDGTEIDDIMLDTLTLADERTIVFYDVVETVTSEELADFDTSGAMSDLDFGVDNQALDESLQASLDGMSDIFESITTTQRYYALSFENTGIILVQVTLSTDIESDNAQFGAMMDAMTTGDVDVETIMADFLNQMQAGAGVPIYDDTNQAITSETEVTASEGLIIPEGWYQVPTDIEDRLIFSDDPEADAATFSFAPDKTLIIIQTGDHGRAIYENDGVNFAQPIDGIAYEISLVEQVEMGLQETPLVETAQIGALTTYTFSYLLDPFYFSEYIYERPSGGYAFTYIITQNQARPEALRPFAILINSLG